MLDIEREVRQRSEQLAEAAQALDHEQYFSFFDQDSFTVLLSDGTVLDSFQAFKHTFLGQVSAIKRYRSLDLDRVNVNVLDLDNVVLTNQYQAVVELVTGKVLSVAGSGVQVWSKRGAQWQLVHVSDAVTPPN